jgi:hypothetical protein
MDRADMEKILRTFVLAAACCGLLVLGYVKLTTDERDRALAEVQRMAADMQERLDAREAMIDRLSRTQRVAHVRILDQPRAEDGGVTETALLFIELDDDGSELARQPFTIPGDVLFVDAWTVKFDHDRVAVGHPLHGRSLVLLRRIYSDRMAPIDGFPIDTPGAVPPGYAAGDAGRFEQQLWQHFWEVATDRALAAAMGVRVAQGEAVYKPVRSGQAFDLLVDATGGMSLTPVAADAGEAHDDPTLSRADRRAGGHLDG